MRKLLLKLWCYIFGHSYKYYVGVDQYKEYVKYSYCDVCGFKTGKGY